MKLQVKNRIYEILIVLYVLFVLWLCVLSRTETVYEVRTLGWSFQIIWNCWWMGYLFLQTVGNVLLYIPLGFVSSCRFGIYKFKFVALISCVTCLEIEVLQFANSCGTLDFDDIVNNIVGAWLGYLAYKMMKTHKVSPVAIVIVSAYLMLGLRVVWLYNHR